MAVLTEHGAAPNTAPDGLAEHGKEASDGTDINEEGELPRH